MKSFIHLEHGDRETTIIYRADILSKEQLSKVKECLTNLNYKKGYNNNNKELSREQLWFQSQSRYFCDDWVYKYSRWESELYPDEILTVQDTIQTMIKDYPVDEPVINSCLINYYKDGNSCIAPHRDNVKSFGVYPTIIGLSVGETRTLKLKHKTKDISYTVELEDNSLFIMAGSSQEYFLHEIPKEENRVGERWSLTFRELK
jgi:alkylated DNA repair dioxygenase AlkB